MRLNNNNKYCIEYNNTIYLCKSIFKTAANAKLRKREGAQKKHCHAIPFIFSHFLRVSYFYVLCNVAIDIAILTRMALV